MKNISSGRFLVARPLIFFIFWLLPAFSCKKEAAPPNTFVSVKFLEDEYPVTMEITTGKWDAANKTASLIASGYHFERFQLLMAHLTDTGTYSNLSVKNIFFTESTDFLPDTVIAGGIHVSYLDAAQIKGEFNIILRDNLQGSLQRTITGSFGISAQ